MTYPHGEDKRSEEPAEGPRGAGRGLLIPLWGRGLPGEGRLGGVLLGGRHLLLQHFLGFWFPTGFPEATSLLEAVRPPAGHTGNCSSEMSSRKLIHTS